MVTEPNILNLQLQVVTFVLLYKLSYPLASVIWKKITLLGTNILTIYNFLLQSDRLGAGEVLSYADLLSIT